MANCFASKGTGKRFGPRGTRFQPILFEETSSQVRLRIQVEGNDTLTHLGEHPGQMIDQRGLADATLVVEKRNDRNAHGFLRTIASTAEL